MTSAISAFISLSGRDCPFGSSDPFPGIKKRKKNAMIVSRLQCDRNFTFVSHLWWNGGYFKKWYFGCVVYCKRPMIQLHVSFIVIYLPLLRTVSQDFIGLCKVFIFINQVLSTYCIGNALSSSMNLMFYEDLIFKCAPLWELNSIDGRIFRCHLWAQFFWHGTNNDTAAENGNTCQRYCIFLEIYVM